ncbi:LytTR family DNA-binding domain-containing protein [uncultured Roseivirga sp.]|uniref:LytR/AlgR family response regulator transcription factor n=1 Tax=uncultured Roseivirga sp. TaxID=543088 RepID=UPI0030DC11F7|tara:strand:- start:298 stop:1026 length:729 start_codon:yes stop_codon:yes gene_type:complete
MTCIIIDDEETSRLILNQLCSEVPDLDMIEEFPNAMSAIKFLNKNDIDLIFLDIHMPDFSGFDFIQTLKNPPRIILTTSDQSLALTAFEYDSVIDYLVKPVERPRFEKAILKAKSFVASTKPAVAPKGDSKNESTAESSNETLYINIDRTLIKIETDSINLIKAEGDYIMIKTREKDYKVHSTLKKIIEKLPSDPFFHVHRSYIINLSRIVDIEDNTILIEKNVIPISRSKRPELMRRLNLL